MDGNHDSGVSDDSPHPLLDALNTQVVPQLQLLGRGALAVGTAQTLRAAVEHGQAVTGTVLQLRVLLGERLYELAVQVVASPAQ